MDYKIVVSPLADKELENIGVFIAKDNPSRAISFVDEMFNSIEKRLSSFPYMGKSYKDNQRMIVYKGYIIFYSVNDSNKTINISHILNPAKYSAYKHLL